jgi:integrase
VPVSSSTGGVLLGDPPLHPAAATQPLALEFALQAGGKAQLGPLPEPVDFSGEVGGELGGVDHQNGFVVLMGGAGAPIEGAGDHGAVVDHRQLIKLGIGNGCGGTEVREAVDTKAKVQAIGGCWKGRNGLCVVAWLLRGFGVGQKAVLEPVLRKPPSLRKNNGAIQMRVRVNGENRLIHRLGKWSDPSAVAKAQALSAQIWSDFCNGCLDPSLERYQSVQAERGRTPLLEGLRELMERKRQGRCTHAYRVLKRYGSGLRTESEVSDFLRWMEAEGLATSTRSTILSTIRSVQPGNQALAAVRVKVPSRSVQEEVLSKGEIKRVLEDLRVNEEWHYPIFSVWLGTGLRNSELIGLTWDCVRLEEGEVLISKTLKRDGSSTHRRVWGGTKTGKSRVVPLREDLVVLLKEHQEQMGELGLDTDRGLVFVTPKTHKHLYDSGLERVWKRSQRRVGIQPRRLYAQRHSFLSHALAMGNSPADLAAVAGHRTEELLKTYAKPTGRVVLPSW